MTVARLFAPSVLPTFGFIPVLRFGFIVLRNSIQYLRHKGMVKANSVGLVSILAYEFTLLLSA